MFEALIIGLLFPFSHMLILGLYGTPRRMGKLKNLDLFDNQFFGIHNKQAHELDPQARILLEVTYEAICDSGKNFFPCY